MTATQTGGGGAPAAGAPVMLQPYLGVGGREHQVGSLRPAQDPGDTEK